MGPKTQGLMGVFASSASHSLIKSDFWGLLAAAGPHSAPAWGCLPLIGPGKDFLLLLYVAPSQPRSEPGLSWELTKPPSLLQKQIPIASLTRMEGSGLAFWGPGTLTAMISGVPVGWQMASVFLALQALYP